MPAPLFTVITLFVAKAASLAINKARATVPASTIWGCMPASGEHLLFGGQLFGGCMPASTNWGLYASIYYLEVACQHLLFGGCMPASLFTVITLFVAKAASLRALRSAVSAKRASHSPRTTAKRSALPSSRSCVSRCVCVCVCMSVRMCVCVCMCVYASKLQQVQS